MPPADVQTRPGDRVVALIARLASPAFHDVAEPLAAAIRACAPVTVVVADGGDADAVRHALREAHEIAVIASAADDPAPAAIDHAVAAAATQRGGAPRLVLVHEPRRRSHEAAAWLAGRRLVPLHVRLDHPADIARVARLLTGCATGLALSGGGARGFAHIGVLKALAEAGTEIDVVTGTSMGAQVGALHALGLTADEIHARCREWVAARPWTDYTLPFASVVRGRRLRRAITHLFGGHRIEDLWVPFACITSNLTRASCDAHTSGPLALLVAASNAVPGLAPPVRYADELHVDGGVLDNLPVAAARALGAAKVVAVDVSSAAKFELPARASLDPSGWALAWDHLRGRPQRLPPVHASLTRALTLASDRQTRESRRNADVVLHLPLAGYVSSDFAALDRIVELGYNEASRRVTEPKDQS